MIIKGTSCAGAARLAAHLTRTDTNERATLKEIRGTAADDLAGALKEMEAIAAGTRSTKPFYHGSINTRADERLTDEQRMYAIDKLEESLGLTGQPRIVVVHEKEGREHCHIVWSRIDLDRMTAISDSHNYRKHEEVARALEREFGHERVQGVHVEREGKARPERTPSHSEMLQADRTGIGNDQAKELMTNIWKATRNGSEFKATLEERGWILARGDRRDFVAIDPSGGIHSIARRIEGVRVADIRQRFADLNPRDLPGVAEAKQVQRGRLEPIERQRGAPSQRAGRPSEPVTAKKARGPATPRGPRLKPSPVRVGDSLFSALLGEKPTPQPKPAISASRREEQEASQRRQELLRQLSREVPPETERDAIIERDRGRDRTRG
ncbi:relaxase/mobilization nuclease domain-containing protein [Bradyrhizobium diazoefficiens]|nr:relaxase/mobilization nuclease domain-containing protein [Bradyrhizobium diazoefficiens]MBR1061105.1 relaxase/mobilization nuclease domain-containing protein [Bradyrhizobium diazoefficiens]